VGPVGAAGPKGDKGDAGPQGDPGPSTPQTIADGSIGTPQLAANAVTSPKIATNAVQASEVAPNAIDSDEVVNGGLTGADIANFAGSFTRNVGPIAANSCSFETPNVDGVDANDYIVINPTLGFPGGLYITPISADFDNVISMLICNATGAPIDPPSLTYRLIAFDAP